MSDKTLSEAVRAILTEGNAETLKPGSKHKDPMPTLSAKKDVIPVDTSVEDLGDAPKRSLTDKNPDASKTVNKDKSKASVSQVKGEPMKHLAKEEVESEDEVIAEDDDIITEEDIDAFVTELRDNGVPEEKIEEAVNEILSNYEQINEDEDNGEELEVVEADDVEESDEEVDDVTPEEQEVQEIEVDLTEDMKALFEGETLSEEFQAKAKLIFETVVKSKLKEYQSQLDTAFEENLVEAVQLVENKLTESAEKYIDYVTEQWVLENEVALEAGLRTELTEDFISGFRNLCLEHHIDIPEERIDVVEELSQKVIELEAKLNEQIEENINLSQVVNESEKEIVFAKETEGLADTQVAKLKELTEAVKFVDEADFSTKIKTLRENYYPKTLKNDKAVASDASDHSGEGVITEDLSPVMQKYVKTIGNTLPN